MIKFCIDKSSFLKSDRSNRVVFFRYTVNGIIRTLTTILIFNICLLCFNYIHSHIFSIIISAYLSSYLNIKFVFLEDFNKKRLIYQFIVSLIYLIASSFLLYILVLLGIDPRIAEIATIGMLFIPFFFLSKIVLYK